MIIVDSREFKSKVVKELFERDVEYQSLQLQVGDYLIGEDICVERKSAKDFVNSLIDRRLFGQLARMKESYKRPILLIESEDDIFSIRKIHPNAIVGLISAIILDYGIPIIFSRNEKETADYLVTMMKRCQSEPKPITKSEKRKGLDEVQESMLQMVPFVGVKASRLLLKKFGRIKDIFNASIDELNGVEGINKRTAEEVHKTANHRYGN